MGGCCGCGSSSASKTADFDGTLAKQNSGETAEKRNAESIKLLRQEAVKVEDATVDQIAAALSNLSVADREKLEKALRSNVVETKPDEEPKSVDGPASLEDARADDEAQRPQGTTEGDDKVEEVPCGGGVYSC